MNPDTVWPWAASKRGRCPLGEWLKSVSYPSLPAQKKRRGNAAMIIFIILFVLLYLYLLYLLSLKDEDSSGNDGPGWS